MAARLRAEVPRDPMRRVSHDRIYQALFVQGRGELRRELDRSRRAGRAAWRSPGPAVSDPAAPGPAARGQAPTETDTDTETDTVMFSETPPQPADRAVPGHWEGDLIFGKNHGSFVGTLVERDTRYVLLLHLPAGHGAGAVGAAMRRVLTALPAQVADGITHDQGPPLVSYSAFTVAACLTVCFCDPRSPWRPGSNENTNQLLRQYLPQDTDLSVHSAADLAAVAARLNGRPRQTLGYLNPFEKLAELIAASP
jgi:IS30 family transposase